MSGPADGDIAILLLAAGASRRMGGRDKMLEPLGDRPLLRERAEICLKTAAARVYVVLPPHAPERRRALEGLDLDCVVAPRAAEGMAFSLRAGIAPLPAGTRGVLVVLADMPEITSDDMDQMIRTAEAGGDDILRATGADGRPGHPVYFPAWCFGAFEALDGDRGARDLLAAHADRLREIPLPGRRATTDLDTPEDWVRWRRRHRL